MAHIHQTRRVFYPQPFPLINVMVTMHDQKTLAIIYCIHYNDIVTIAMHVILLLKYVRLNDGQ